MFYMNSEFYEPCMKFKCFKSVICEPGVVEHIMNSIVLCVHFYLVTVGICFSFWVLFLFCFLVTVLDFWFGFLFLFEKELKVG